MTHRRLFVALPLPLEARRMLIAAMGGVAGARWQDDEQLHCTVRFLGELDRHRAEDVAAALSAIAHPSIDATLDGLGSFDRRGRIDTLWVGVQPLDTLRGLHAKVDAALRRASVAPDSRAYRPHVTIARFGNRNSAPADIAVRLPPPPQIGCRFDELRLYESTLGRDGARYEIVASYPLR